MYHHLKINLILVGTLIFCGLKLSTCNKLLLVPTWISYYHYNQWYIKYNIALFWVSTNQLQIIGILHAII